MSVLLCFWMKGPLKATLSLKKLCSKLSLNWGWILRVCQQTTFKLRYVCLQFSFTCWQTKFSPLRADHITSSYNFVVQTYTNTEHCLCYSSCSAENTPTETGITGHSRVWGHLRLSGTILTWWLFNVSFISIPKLRLLHQQLLFTPSTSRMEAEKGLS